MKLSSYKDYQLKNSVHKFIELNGFESPTAIQQAVIPSACKGKDIIGISDTGSGKTHAFLIPIMERVTAKKPVVQAVITAPTRELAQQLYNEAKKMSEADPDLRIMLIRGGTDKSRVSASLKQQPHIVIGTPGRIRDMFLNEQTLRLDTAGILVVDEADMTLEFGFLEDIDVVASRMKSNLQMMSFSATIPQGLKPFLKKYMKDPKTIEIKGEHDFQSRVNHILVPCKHETYESTLLEVLQNIDPYVCVIFANTRTMAASVAKKMREEGYRLVELHGDLEPRERARALKQLFDQDITYVVATDIAARGIDVEGVTHVISLGFPQELDFYIHRSGRTGRAGRDGTCYALYKDNDMKSIKSLINRGISFERKTIKNGEWVNLKQIGVSKGIKNDETEKEIAKIVHRKKQKVKPGYKKKRKAEIDKLKRKAKRQFVHDEIQTQKKERAKEKQRAKYNEDENW